MSKIKTILESVLQERLEDIISKYTNLSEDEQIEAVKYNPANIEYIDNPSEKVQLAAVNIYGGVLGWLMKMKRDGRLQSEISDAVKYAAIKQYPFAIAGLPTSMQTQELQSLAVSEMPNAVLYIWKPTEETWNVLKKNFPQYFDIIYKNWNENYAERQARKAAKAAAMTNTKKESELEEGKFGKFLGTMATAAAIGLGGLHSNPAQAVQYDPSHKEQVLDQKFYGQVETPAWVKDAGKLTSDKGQLFFINEIVRPESSDNTAQLERVAGAEGGAKLARTLIDAVNNNLDESMNSINSNNLKVASMVPQGSFWLLLKSNNGPEYHAYSKIRVDQSQIAKSLAGALKQANPKANNAKIQQVVKNALNSIMG